jgi:hypothetical protein
MKNDRLSKFYSRLSNKDQFLSGAEYFCDQFSKHVSNRIETLIMRNYYILFILFLGLQLSAQTPCSSGFISNGTDDFITIPGTDAINLQNTRNRTIEFWFKTSDITTRQVIYEEGAQVNAFLFYLEGGRIYLGAYRNDASVAADRRLFRSGSGEIETDQWYHIALTLEDTTSPDLTLKWYLNGTEQDSQNGLQVNTHSGDISFVRNGGSLRFPSSTTSNWVASSVGGVTSETYNSGFNSGDSNDYNYGGNITLFRIWNVARTAVEIDSNKSTLLTSETDLVAYLDQDRINYQPDNGSAISNAVTVDGNEQYTEIPNTDAINLQNTRNRTIEFRFNASDMTTRQVLYEEGGGTNAITFFIEDDRVYLGAYRNNGSATADRRFFRSATGAVVADQWYHVAITLEDTASPDLTLKWYLDGVEQDSQDGLQVNSHSGNISIGRSGDNIRYPSSLVSNWVASSIGASSAETYNSSLSGSDSNTYNFTGDFDLFRIWNVARTAVEIDTNKATALSSGTSLVAYQDGVEINYQPDGGSSISATVSETGVFIWEGNSSKGWSTATNWAAGSLPNTTKAQAIVITDGTNEPEITTEVLIGKLTIESGAEIVVKSGGTLNVYYDIINNGTITVEDGGALIFNSCTKTPTGSGVYTVKRNSPDYEQSKFFSYWSSPLVEADSAPGTLFPESPVIYSFNANQMTADWEFHDGSNLKPGNGYAVRSEGAGSYTASFTGTPNFRNISVALYNNMNADASDTVSSGGDNLVGNPYASAIDWDLVITDPDNEHIQGTIFVWDQNSAYRGNNTVDDYLEYNITGGASNTTTGKLGTGQGFFVRVTSNSTIIFKTTHQIAANNTTFYRGGGVPREESKKAGRSWLEFTKGEDVSPILVGFVKGATSDFDRLYDSKYNLKNTSFGFYSLAEDAEKLAIQGLPKLTDYSKEIPLGYVVEETGEHTIRITEEYIDSQYQIYLEDTMLETFTNLREEAYTFMITEAGENNTRFKIHYTQSLHLNKDLLPAESEYHIYVDGIKDIKVLLRGGLSDASVKGIQVYDIQGRRVSHFEQALGERKTLNIANLNTGFYIVNVTLYDSGKRLTKKIIVSN